MKKTAWNFKKLFIGEIQKNGGWVNAHAHADRAFTMNPDSLDIYRNHDLVEKWDLVDDVKHVSADEYYRRVSLALEVLIANGVTALGSFIDVDPVCEDKAVRGALKAREHYKDQITVKFITQTLKGLIDKDARKWFEIGAEKLDIIGGLPKHDELAYGKGYGLKHMDILLKTAKKYKKMVHVHVDQFNTVTDRETEQLADKTIEHGMEGKVVAIHGISIGAHPKKYRDILYKKMKKADLMMVACPIVWIDSKRSETLQPFHNSITPIDELIPAGITVAMGTDNLCDYVSPFPDGDMWSELTLLSAANRYLNIDELVKIATTNGRKVLGIK